MEPHVFAVADRAYRSMRHYALSRGYSLSDHGVRRHALSGPHFPPHLELARPGRLPAFRVTPSRARGLWVAVSPCPAAAAL